MVAFLNDRETDMADKDEIRCFVVGNLETNCYAYVSEGDCLVVDPGASGAALARELEDVRVTQVVATHRHHDHVGGVRALVEATGSPWAIGAGDAEDCVRALEMSSHDFVTTTTDIADPPAPTRVLHEDDTVSVGSARFRVIDAPGHTPGGIVLVGEGSAEGIAFVGDTLFAGSCGRTDLAGGSWDQMSSTLKRLAGLIDPPCTLLCGHGPVTTMQQELATNPYLQPDAWRPSFH